MLKKTQLPPPDVKRRYGAFQLLPQVAADRAELKLRPPERGARDMIPGKQPIVERGKSRKRVQRQTLK